MPVLDYVKANTLLTDNFSLAEQSLLNQIPPKLKAKVTSVIDTIFNSKTQAYREVLLGCTLAKLLDTTINIRHPYIDQGPLAFSGRSLDERVINPFLQNKRIPCSRGPYLSVFRRSVQFNKSTRSGVRDKAAYDALLSALSHLEDAPDEANLLMFFQYALYKFVELREESNVPVQRLHRISLDQYDKLITGLLEARSGGLLPVLIVLSVFNTIKSVYNQDWTITWQGINVADTASGAGGDITITRKGQTLMAVEVTERSIDKTRVVATFNNKISPSGLEDYLFIGSKKADLEARKQANQYFAQGHEVNFVDVKDWALALLATLGKEGRAAFNKELTALINSDTLPKALKVTWNQTINAITST